MEIRPPAKIVITATKRNTYTISIDNEIQAWVVKYCIYHHAGCRPVFAIQKRQVPIRVIGGMSVTHATYYHIKELRIEHEN